MFIRKVFIVQNNLSNAESINTIVNHLGHQTVGFTDNYNEALNILENTHPDLVIIDLDIKGNKTGVDLANKLTTEYKLPFIVASEQFDNNTLRKIKKIAPSAYLNFPINKYELEYAIISTFEKHLFSKIESLRKKDPKYLIIKDKKTVQKIPINDILFLKSDNIYTDIYTKTNGKFSLRKGMKNVIEDLDISFFRVHRSYTVNLNEIKGVKSKTILVNNTEIPLSRDKKQFIQNYFLEMNK